MHPPSASRILLPDGRYMAYPDQGVPADRARSFDNQKKLALLRIAAYPIYPYYSGTYAPRNWVLILFYCFFNSLMVGIPGVKTSLLDEYGVAWSHMIFLGVGRDVVVERKEE